MGMTVVEDVQSLVEIAAGKSASHLALLAHGARVVVFAFDAGAELKEHVAQGPILVQALSGRLEFTAEGEAVELRRGGLIHLDARIPHSVRALEQSRMLLTIIRHD